MPNWCYNRVEIYGENPDQIKEVKEKLEGKKTCFDFNNIVPMPDWKNIPNENGELPKLQDHVWGTMYCWEDGSQDDRWYHWCWDNWDTKWNSRDATLTEDGDGLEYVFDTAWGPPRKVIEALREQYPDLSVTAFYDEPAMEIAGYC